MKKYIPQEIEKKWQEAWRESHLYDVNLKDSKDKYYMLVELAYSSGDLHMGHWFTYSYGDVMARFKKFTGLNVIFPNGFDAFGLPAENAAIKNGIHPSDWTYANVERMIEQFKTLGAMFDWRYTTIACDPKFYKWNQWLFLKLYEKGLAYKGKVLSNWCPSCMTVLANENVESGKCWRCGSEVIQKQVDQWFFKITDYADKLIWSETPEVDWPQALTDAQNKWIGKSEGLLINFEDIEVFTTRPDTIFGVTFLVLSPEHSLVKSLTTDEQKSAVGEYVSQAKTKSELERKENKQKTGVFTGSFVKNPLSGDSIPVWIADYVLPEYGTGAVMAVPAHDERDFEFASKYNLPIKAVIEPILGSKREDEEFRKSIVALVYDPEAKKYLSIKWKGNLGGNLLVGGGIEEDEEAMQAALREIKEETGYKNLKLVQTTEKIHYHYHAISKNKNRKIEVVGLLFELVDQDSDPIKLEKDEIGQFEVEWLSKGELEDKLKDELHLYVFNHLVNGAVYTGEGLLFNSGDFDGTVSSIARETISKHIKESNIGTLKTQYHLHDWSISRQRYWGTPIPIINCQKCGVVPVPEKDLPVELPYKVDYTPKGKPPLATAEEWIEVACPKCGGVATREAETMDTFIDSAWYFFRYLDPNNDLEIFDRQIIERWMPVDLYIGGSEHTLGHALYSRFITMFLHDLGLIKFKEYARKRVHHGLILGTDGNKMSKSKGNVINPDDQVAQYGADAVRVYLSFLGPFDIVTSWKVEGINGIYHYLQRVWGLSDKVNEAKMSQSDLKMMHKTINKVTKDLDQLKNNTSIASLMEWLNYLSKKTEVTRQEYEAYLILLAPFAPHMTEELWTLMGNEYSIHNQSWPEFDSKHLEEDMVNIAVQVNGRVRDLIEVSKDLNQEQVEELVKGSLKINKFLEGREVKKIIYIPGKIFNIVV